MDAYTIVPLDPERHAHAATALYEAAFPSEERRPTPQWLETLRRGAAAWQAENATTSLPHATGTTRPYAMEIAGELAGFFVIWPMERFVYGEHFAVRGDLRGHGLGGKLLDRVVHDYAGRPFVIEVERPESSDLAQRRCAFYERHGLHLINKDYLQPPYREGDGWFPLRLMTTDEHFVETHYDYITREIHRVVYGITSAEEETGATATKG